MKTKTLKFLPELIAPIFSGEKTTTWRINDDKQLERGDVLEATDSKTLKPFAHLEVIRVDEKGLGALSEKELKVHGYDSLEQLYERYGELYGCIVNAKTPLKVISFRVLDDLR